MSGRTVHRLPGRPRDRDLLYEMVGLPWEPKGDQRKVLRTEFPPVVAQPAPEDDGDKDDESSSSSSSTSEDVVEVSPEDQKKSEGENAQSMDQEGMAMAESAPSGESSSARPQKRGLEESMGLQKPMSPRSWKKARESQWGLLQKLMTTTISTLSAPQMSWSGQTC